MTRKMYLFEWNDGLGEGWLNIDSLKSLLFSSQHISEEGLLTVREISNTEIDIMAADQADLLQALGDIMETASNAFLKSIIRTRKNLQGDNK
jgi:hypothetical protein